MKRDIGLIRELLFYIEGNSSEYEFITTLNLEVIQHFEQKGFPKEAINYHLSLMYDAGFILSDNPIPLGQQGFWMIQRLTFSGHDFIDTLRDETVWNKFKAKFINEGAGFTLKIASGLALEIAKQLFL